uniref:hypothetical protein n=1 Tax=Lachnospira eligens TaxID=39485 RepID=UPI0040273AD7
MELLRVLRKSVVFIAIFLGIIIWLSIFKINNTNDKKVYAYYNQLMYEYDNQTEMIESLTYSKYVHDKTDDYEADREYIEEAIKLLQEKYQYVYSSDMSRAENNYKKIINSTLFAEEQSYYVLNAQKYMADLESRGEINFSITNTTAIEKLVSDKQLPVIFLVMMIFVLITFMEEFENNMFLQIRGSKNSRKVLPVKRCFIILLISIVLSFVFNGVILAIYKNIYGCNMGSLIQNSYMFNMFQLKTNVATFFIIYCITFAIAMSVLSWLVYFVFLITGNYKLSIVLFPGQSYYIYENWGTDNFITDIQSTTWLLTILLAITGLIGVYITYSHKYAQGRKSAITKIIEKCSQFIQMLLGKVPLFVSELYKTLILQKGIILLAAAVYLLISCRMYRGVDYSNTDFSMNNFYSMFSGNTGDKECEAYIEECRNAVEELGKKAETDANYKYKFREASQTLENMENCLNYVRKVNEEKGIEARIVNPAAYEDIFGSRKYQNTESQNLVCVIFLILIISGEYAYEKRCHMIAFLNTSKERSRVKAVKLLKILMISFFIWGLSAFIDIFNICQLYKLEQLSAPIQSLQIFYDLPFNISIAWYMVIGQAFRLVLLLIISIGIYGITKILDYKGCLVITFMVLVMPYLLFKLGINSMKYLSVEILMDFGRIIGK